VLLLTGFGFGEDIGHWYQDEYFHVREGYVCHYLAFLSFSLEVFSFHSINYQNM